MKRALLSVSDKTDIIPFAQKLESLGYEIISTGGTAHLLESEGIAVQPVEAITHFPEMLEGRVKTLHPFVHAGILAKGTKEHLDTIASHGIEPIDVVVVNLYPFEETVENKDVLFSDAIENIDIGGPSMVRAAAKNYERVLVVVDPNDYPSVVQALEGAKEDALLYRQKMAVKAFEHTASYDAAVSSWLRQHLETEVFPKDFAIGGHRNNVLRYGENPHQEAAIYATSKEEGTLAFSEQLGGKPLSYNNYVDLDAAWKLVCDYKDSIACAIIKHTNPCGIALGENATEAYAKALAADSKSAFGGIVALNTEVDASVANKVVEIFTEAIIAPSYTEEAVGILRTKENLRILATGACLESSSLWIEPISGGFLLQTPDIKEDLQAEMQVVTERKPTSNEWADLLFAWKAVKHVRSNAIVVAKNAVNLGVGAGQMNRVGAVAIALEQAGDKSKDSVLASDAFFPFADSIETAAKAGIRAIIQPGGSIRDQEVIDACNRLNIAMVFTGTRHFKH